jgi:hypothetical protein
LKFITASNRRVAVEVRVEHALLVGGPGALALLVRFVQFVDREPPTGFPL